jgi:hypothetical protein
VIDDILIYDPRRAVALTASAPTAAYFVIAFLYARESGISMLRPVRLG